MGAGKGKIVLDSDEIPEHLLRSVKHSRRRGIVYCCLLSKCRLSDRRESPLTLLHSTCAWPLSAVFTRRWSSSPLVADKIGLCWWLPALLTLPLSLLRNFKVTATCYFLYHHRNQSVAEKSPPYRATLDSPHETLTWCLL